MNTTETTTLGSRIAAHRRRLGLTQDQLAERVGVSPQAVSKWENDLSCPDISVLPQLAEIFGVSTDELLGRATKAEPVYQGEIVNDQEDDSKEPKGLHIDFNFDGGRWGAIFFALWIVAMGAMLLAGKLLKLPFGFWTAAWTTGLVALGLSSMRKHVGLFGICLTASGIYFILDAFAVFGFALSWDILFPALLLIWGVSLLVDALTKKKRKHHSSAVFSPNSNHTSNVHASADGYLNFSESFGENHYVMRTQEFKGGEISASFGDYSVDLTQCASVAEDCDLDVNCSFGELTLIVPRRFLVETDSSKAFSALEIQGEPAPNPQGTISADISVSFGSVVIKYV